MHSSYGITETHHSDLSLPVHERIADLHSRSARLAPAVEDSAADSGCTDKTRREHGRMGPRQVKAWDMVAEALGWNAISDDAETLNEAERLEREGIAYHLEYGSAGWQIVLAEQPEDEPVANPRPFSGGQPRCTTCHRANHRPGEWQGHYFTGPELSPPVTGAEYYVILTGFRAPANRPAGRFSYKPGEAGRAFAEAMASAAHLAARDAGARSYDVYHADTEGQVLIVTVAGHGGLSWPRR